MSAPSFREAYKRPPAGEEEKADPIARHVPATISPRVMSQKVMARRLLNFKSRPVRHSRMCGGETYSACRRCASTRKCSVVWVWGQAVCVAG